MTPPLREVVGAVIVRDGRVLLTQRLPGKSFPFCWESPGGGVEAGESQHDALRRECREELGIDVCEIPQQALWCGEVASPNGGARVSLYLVTEWTGEPTPREGQGLGWYEPCEIPGLVMTPANVAAMVEVVRAVEASADHGRANVLWSSIEETVRAAGRGTMDADCTACGKPAEFISGSAGCTVLCTACIAGAPDDIPRARLDGSEPNAAWVASVAPYRVDANDMSARTIADRALGLTVFDVAEPTPPCLCVGDGCTGFDDERHVCVTGNACGVTGCSACGGVASTAAEVLAAMPESLRQLAADPARREAFNAWRPADDGSPARAPSRGWLDPYRKGYLAGRASRDEEVANAERLVSEGADEIVQLRAEADAAHTALDVARIPREHVETDGDFSERIVDQRTLTLAERIRDLVIDRDFGWGCYMETQPPSTAIAPRTGHGECSMPTNVFYTVDGKPPAGWPAAEPQEWR